MVTTTPRGGLSLAEAKRRARRTKLVLTDSDGVLTDNGVYYGNTGGGGVITADCSVGCGTVYKIVNGEESVIYRFLGGSDGAFPYDGLLLGRRQSLRRDTCRRRKRHGHGV